MTRTLSWLLAWTCTLLLVAQLLAVVLGRTPHQQVTHQAGRGGLAAQLLERAGP